MITPDLLIAAVGCTADRAALFAPHLDDACKHYQINTPARLAAFLSQVGHESGSFRYVREIASGDAYEGRKSLGNTESGDGRRYRGRGLIQATGRYNYRKLSERMRAIGAPDFEASPEALEDPKWAAWSACDWWAAHDCNQLADVGAFDQITRVINGGTNGQEDRRARWAKAKAALAAHAEAPAAPVESAHDQRSDSPDWPVQQKAPMAPFIIPAVVELAKLLPKLGSLFATSEQAQKNVGAAQVVLDSVVSAVGASNAQEAVERVAADPVARDAADKAVEAVWYQVTTESGGGGIDGARKADRASSAAGDMLHSPSFWALILLLPLVYLLVASLIGLIGTATWSDDVRAGLAGSIISAVIGGAVGYYWGQTTSRNRGAS